MGILTPLELVAVEAMFTSSALDGDPVTFGNFEFKIKKNLPLVEVSLAPYTISVLIELIDGSDEPDDEISYSSFLKAYKSLP
ncbi:hypothetical protein [Pseudomonas sp. TWR3-1-1]|uniref:hypothetical protein n=1 Tax=Pseudomonas sp. TWR3-1-1 TaxID=2804633 RepID=UPI003CF906A3